MVRGPYLTFASYRAPHINVSKFADIENYLKSFADNSKLTILFKKSFFGIILKF